MSGEWPEHLPNAIAPLARNHEHARPEYGEAVAVNDFVDDLLRVPVGRIKQVRPERLNETYGIIAMSVIGVPGPDMAAILNDRCVKLSDVDRLFSDVLVESV